MPLAILTRILGVSIHYFSALMPEVFGVFCLCVCVCLGVLASIFKVGFFCVALAVLELAV